MDLIKELRRLSAGATAGEWGADMDVVTAIVAKGRPGGEVIVRCHPYINRVREDNEANATLIVALRNNIDAILDRLESAEAALDEVAKGEGAFSRDPLQHASNCIDHAKSVARAHFTKYGKDSDDINS